MNQTVFFLSTHAHTERGQRKGGKIRIPPFPPPPFRVRMRAQEKYGLVHETRAKDSGVQCSISYNIR